jgi:hypothetical protein
MLKRLLPAAALIFGLAVGLVWCAGPCCASMGSTDSPLSIGAVPCCGSGTPSGCQTTMQRAANLVTPPHAPLLPPIAVLGHGVAAPPPSMLHAAPIAVPPMTARPDLARLATPLLI